MSEDLHARVAVTETQIGRIVSDIESEKETRTRMNSEILRRIDDVQSEAENRRAEFNRQFDEVHKIIWKAVGAAGVLNALAGIAVAIWAILHK